MENSNEKSKECEQCKYGCLMAGNSCKCPCHKPSVEVSKCCGAEALIQVGGIYGCKKCENYCEIKSSSQSIPIDRDEGEEKCPILDCNDILCPYRNNKKSSTPKLTPESTEMEEWDKEFDKEFVRDDGLMDKYTYDEDGDSVFMATAIKSFIKELLSTHSQKLVSEIKGNIAGMKLTNSDIEPIGGYCSEFAYGYNEAIHRIINNIKI